MSLLPKRRSRSETRDNEVHVNKNNSNKNNNNNPTTNQNNIKNLWGKVHQNAQFPQMVLMGMGKRRTSAEMISEAKTFLSDVGGGGGGGSISNTQNTQQQHPQPTTSVVGGVRMVSTRRPVTPREPGRVLYGKVTMAGRPPSSFSLRYLRNTDSQPGGPTPRTPNLEPMVEDGMGSELGEGRPLNRDLNDKKSLQQPQQNVMLVAKSLEGGGSPKDTITRRAQSLELPCDEANKQTASTLSGKNSNNNNTNNCTTTKQLPTTIAPTNSKPLPRKLPALEVKGNTMKKDNFPNFRNQLRAKTAYSEQSQSHNRKDENSILLIDENGANNRAITLLETRKILTRSNDLLGQSSTEKLIDMLKEHAGLKDCTEETANHINSILTELYNRVHKNEDNFKKGFILGGLYGLVECNSSKILLAVARVVLALRVSGSNLTGACKLIFKVARNEQNDYLFHENDILELLIDGLGRASPLEDPEACIYGYGSIRFLTCSTNQERAELTAIKDLNRNWSEQVELPRKPNTAPNLGEYPKISYEKTKTEYVQKISKQDALVLRLSRHGAVQLMILHLQMLNEAGATRKLEGPPLHSLYQLSAALRTLADVRKFISSLENLDVTRPHFDNTSIHLELACPHLIKAAEVTIGEVEVQANIIRTLSVLSEDWDCCHAMEKFAPRIGMLLGPCCTDHNTSNAEKLLSIISRLGYILGNIMTNYDLARIQFFHNDVAMEYLLNVLENYSKEPLTLHNSLGDTVLDVLIKMIRVLANMSVDSEVGHGLGDTRSLGAILLEILKTTQQLKSIKMKQELQELCHATLGALHNLCFYQDQITTTPSSVQEAQGSLRSVLPDLATQLCGVLKNAQDELSQVEAARVLGNLTRNENARKYFCRAKGLKLVVKILSNPQTKEIHDLQACTIGILVNLLGDIDNRMPFIQLKGPQFLLELLIDALKQNEDWFMGTIICQAYWNLFIDTAHLEDVCDDTTLDDLIDLLSEYLDDDKLLQMDQMFSQHQVWEDFTMVSSYLLDHLQSHYGQQSEGLQSEGASDLENDEDDVYIDGI
ncbi:armadillo repeat-containing protein 2 [Stomoxys calcitrans]|uniref:armadillo repeat-containing protein 2 n=1 Tax=Stomoxys calcitrans TaxID=35570 RepID=UPI0027E35292|nr:armadillo repeat-containing protein 2 [Stomoxys calcitrans]